MLSDRKLLSLLSNQALHLFIMPTEQCNFRCTYCYEDFAIGKMQPDVIQGIKQFLMARIPELTHLKVSWFGGEPLAAKNIVYHLGEFINTAITQRPQLSYQSDITTNAFNLKPEVLTKLTQFNIRHFQISLDGTQLAHDKTRIRMNGDGTFQTIWKNLLNAQLSDLDFHIIIRIHLTPDNLPDIDELIVLLKQHLGFDKRFIILFKGIENLGGANGGTFTTLTWQAKQALVSAYQKKLAPELTGVTDTNEPYVCYAAQPNSLIVRANGQISKCTVALNDNRNLLGNINQLGELALDDSKLKLWARGLKHMNLKELHCPLHNMPS